MTGRRSGTYLRALFSFELAGRHLTASVARLAVTILAIGVGVSLVVAVRIMNAGVLASFLETVDRLAGRAALTVTAGEGFAFPENVVGQIGGVTGVKVAVPLVRSVAFPDDGSGELLTVLGIDLANETAVRLYHDAERTQDIVEDPLAFLSQPDSVIVGREWASKRRLGVGDQLTLVTPTGTRAFTVRGLVEPEGLARTLAGRVVVLDIFAAQRAFAADGQINQVDLVLRDGMDAARVKEAVRAVLPAGLTVREPAVRREVIRTTVNGFQSMLMAFAFLAVVAGFVICYSRLRSLFDARTWEIGLLRAVGIRQGVVFLELLKESAMLGAAGVALGVPLGVWLARWAFPFVAAATAINFRLPVPAASKTFEGSAIVLGAAVGILAAVFAAAVPAIRLARTQPVAALRLRGRTGPPLRARTRILAGGGLLLASGVLIALEELWQLSALGIPTTACLTLAVLAFANPLVVYGGRVLRGIFALLFGQVGRFAASEVTQQAPRASLAVATLAVGLGSVMLFGILGWSFERSLVGQLGARFQGQLVINSAFLSGGWMASPVHEQILPEIEAIPGVHLASAQQLTEIEYEGTSISLFSYDPPCFRDGHVCRWPVVAGALPDALEQVAAGSAVLVSASVAREHGIRSGDALTLPSPSGPQTFRVAGIAKEEPAKAIIMSRARYSRAWNDRMVTWIHVVLDRPEEQAAVAASIARALGQRYRLQVRPVREFLAYLADQARQAFRLLYVMEAVTLCLVLFGITDALAAGVMERTRQFGMMRAVGLRRSHLFALVLLVGGVVGVLGVTLAGVAGVGLSSYWVYVQFPTILGWNLGYSIPGAFVAVAALLALLLTLVGSLGPALRAVYLPISKALRDE